MSRFDEFETRLLRALEDPLPIVDRPYAVLAERSGLDEPTVIRKIADWIADGTIRRLGARVNHHTVGYTANGMCVWRVLPQRIESAGKFIATVRQVSHCYRRKPGKGWNYNLYAMIHAKSREEVLALAERISKVAGLKEYKVLFSIKELKKTPPKYFPD